MPWCPECKTEYEDGYKQCADCEIDLVDKLEEAVMYRKLIVVTKEEASKIAEFLKYSKINDFQMREEEKNQILFLVHEKEHKKAVDLLRVYLVEQAKEDQDEHEDDFYVNEYKTEDIADNNKKKEMESSYISFLVTGFLLEVFCILNLVGVLKILDNKAILYLFMAVGVGFFAIAIFTKRKIPDIVDDHEYTEAEVQRIVAFYEKSVNLSSFYEDNEINSEDYNEGALYFVVIDVIKGNLKDSYPNVEDSIINTAAEEIFNKL